MLSKRQWKYGKGDFKVGNIILIENKDLAKQWQGYFKLSKRHPLWKDVWGLNEYTWGQCSMNQYWFKEFKTSQRKINV